MKTQTKEVVITGNKVTMYSLDGKNWTNVPGGHTVFGKYRRNKKNEIRDFLNKEIDNAAN